MALSTEDRALALAATRWAYANGWKPRWVNSFDGQDHNTCWRKDDQQVWTYLYRETGNGAVEAGESNVSVQSVQQAVDALVLLGVLPVDMSSAFREGADTVTDLSIMQAVDAKLDEIWEAFQLAHVQHAIVDRLAHLLKDDSPFAMRHAAKDITTVVADVLEREVTR